MGEMGISVYPSKMKMEDMFAYMEKASRIGYKRLFMSMLEIETTSDDLISCFKKTIQYGNQLGLKTTLDISPKVLSKLGLSYDQLEFFAELGIHRLRLDEGFTGYEEAKLTHNQFGIMIDINISRGQHYIDLIKDFGAYTNQLSGSHNFYPQTYTGLDIKYFIEESKRFKRHHIETTAFIDSPTGKYGPWSHANLMVTTEVQRKMSMVEQIQLMKVMGVIDDVIISSSLVDLTELKASYESFSNPLVQLPIVVENGLSSIEKQLIFDEVHQYRGDHSSYMIRSSQMRLRYQDKTFASSHTDNLKKGMVSICNQTAGQYKGELQIALRDRANDGTHNVVGYIPETSLILLDFIKPWSSFLFINY